MIRAGMYGWAAASLALAMPALAQVNPVFDMPVLTMNAALAGNARHASGSARGDARRAAPTTTAPVSFPYAASPELRRQVLARFLARVERQSPTDAARIRHAFARHDYARTYAQIVTPYGLR